MHQTIESLLLAHGRAISIPGNAAGAAVHSARLCDLLRPFACRRI